MELEILNSSMVTPTRDGEIQLASGEQVRMRLWREAPRNDKSMVAHGYETVGYVLKGEALLTIGSTTTELREGDSWCVPRGVEHKYTIKTSFEAVEAIAPVNKS